jgi:large subunit ribosomal protein L29
MEVEKLRNLTDAELTHQQRELNDQLFRMKFQLKMGQTESLNKLRGLRKDVARIKTIMREKELGLANGSRAVAAASSTEAAETAETPARAKAKPAAHARKSAAARKTAAAKKTTAASKAKKKSSGAKAKARKK